MDRNELRNVGLYIPSSHQKDQLHRPQNCKFAQEGKDTTYNVVCRGWPIHFLQPFSVPTTTTTLAPTISPPLHTIGKYQDGLGSHPTQKKCDVGHIGQAIQSTNPDLYEPQLVPLHSQPCLASKLLTTMNMDKNYCQTQKKGCKAYRKGRIFPLALIVHTRDVA